MAFVVIVCFFSHRDEENEGERCNIRYEETYKEGEYIKGTRVLIREAGPTCSESRNKLGQCDKKEIEVEEEFELLVKHDGQEREHIVLLVADDIWGELVL